MSDSFYSASWYRVAELRPRLRKHAHLTRQVYRGEIWYVLHDSANGKSHRFAPQAFRFIGLMDGQRTVQQIWDIIVNDAGDDAPTQDEAIRLLGQLHAADALICNAHPDADELFRRFRRQEDAKLRQRLLTPLAIRIPLFDPEQFLNHTYKFVAPLFTRLGGLVWLLTIITAAVLAGSYWEPLTTDIVDRALTPNNLFVLWLTYPCVKALHELGHGYAVKFAGGEVHEIGVMVLVLMPVPYIDASSAWAIQNKWQRMLIGAAGILVEMFLGAIALFVWINAEPGIVKAFAYNVILISGVSTLLFNGNPLLKFDGYYVLSDAIETPNLAQRSNQFLGYLAKRFLFRMPDIDSPATNRGEQIWFSVYGISAFLYRMMIMFVIVLYIGAKYFVVGVILALWSVSTQVFLPLFKNVTAVLREARATGSHYRASLNGFSTVVLLVTLALFIPLPFWTVTDGVIWPGDKTRLRAGTDGFIAEILVADGSRVSAGDVLIKMRDPLLESKLQVLTATVKGLERQLMLARATDRVQVALIREELDSARADLRRIRERVDNLVIRSHLSGKMTLPEGQDLEGKFFRKGDPLGYVTQPADLRTIRVAVTNEQVALIAEETLDIHVRSSTWGSPSHEANLSRVVPGGTMKLPATSLGTEGGGHILVDPTAGDGLTTFSRIFELDVMLPETVDPMLLGQRVSVRFDHGMKPLFYQVYRGLRQVFLARFGI